MTPPMSPATGVVSVSVGLCAYNEERGISAALESVLSQDVSAPFSVDEVIVVASGCTDRTESIVHEWSAREPRVLLVHQDERMGKARALNVLFRRANGHIVVSMNADAMLMPESLQHLLEPFESNPRLQVACGSPQPSNVVDGLSGMLTRLQWRLHNRTLALLSSRGMPNHCCDELVALRRGFIDELPPDLINDGAYLAVVAASRDSFVSFCDSARVVVDPPRTLRGFLMQRRRILRGHRQVRELCEQSPYTLEGLMRTRPDLVARIIGGESRSSPSSALTLLLLLLPLESVALVGASLDALRGRNYEPAWTPVN